MRITSPCFIMERRRMLTLPTTSIALASRPRVKIQQLERLARLEHFGTHSTLRRQIATADCYSDMPAHPIECAVSHLSYRADIRSCGQPNACGDQRLTGIRCK